MKAELRDTHLYFPIKVLEGIKRLAEKNRRSLTAEVIIAVEKHLSEARTNGRTKSKGEGK